MLLAIIDGSQILLHSRKQSAFAHCTVPGQEVPGRAAPVIRQLGLLCALQRVIRLQVYKWLVELHPDYSTGRAPAMTRCRFLCDCPFF